MMLGHAPIGEYCQRFFPNSSYQCPCSEANIEIQEHIFMQCKLYDSSCCPRDINIMSFLKFIVGNPTSFCFGNGWWRSEALVYVPLHHLNLLFSLLESYSLLFTLFSYISRYAVSAMACLHAACNKSVIFKKKWRWNQIDDNFDYWRSPEPVSNCTLWHFFVPTTLLPLPSKLLTPESNSRVRTGTQFPIKLNPSSDILPLSIHSIVPLLRRLCAILGLPLSPPPSTLISLPHSDRILEWHSALTGIRAANRFSYFTVVSRMSTQSNGEWHDQDSSPGVTSVPSKEKEEVEEGKEGEAIPGSCEPVHWGPSLPWTEVVGRNLDDFLTLLRVK